MILYDEFFLNQHIIIFLIISLIMSIEDIKKMEVSLVKQSILFVYAIYSSITYNKTNYLFIILTVLLIFIILSKIRLGGADKKILLITPFILGYDSIIFFYILSICVLIIFIYLKNKSTPNKTKYPFLPIISTTLAILLVIKMIF